MPLLFHSDIELFNYIENSLVSVLIDDSSIMKPRYLSTLPLSVDGSLTISDETIVLENSLWSLADF
jgi:hypothetical protein